MSKRAYITSPESLQDLSNALQRTSYRYLEELESIEIEIKRKIDFFEEIYDYHKRNVNRCQEEYDEAEEEMAKQYAFDSLESAEESFQQAQRYINDVEEALSEYKRQVRQVRELFDNLTPQACVFLNRKFDELQEYLSLKLISKTSDVLIAANSTPAIENQESQNIENFPLPKGFEWVSLNSITPKELGELPSDIDFKKVARSEVQIGFELLKNTILPTIKQLGDKVDSLYFQQLDQQLNEENIVKLEAVYSAFFGLDHIYLTGKIGESSLDITNGRHRIKVALALGWRFIPAKVKRIQ